MDTNNWDFIIAAYAVVWVAVIGYWVWAHSALRAARARYSEALAAAARAGEKLR